MSSLMKRDGAHVGEHVGFQICDMGNGVEQRSPLYEVDGFDGRYHMTGFLDERSGGFIHHIHRAKASNLTVRYDKVHRRQISYDNVRWFVALKFSPHVPISNYQSNSGVPNRNMNGLDFTMCSFGGSTSGWSVDAAANRQTAWDQFNYQVPPNNDGGLTSTANSVEVDLYNEAATVIGSVQIVGYSGSTAVNPPSCASPSATLNEDCIIA
jgi:hypothetical protein